MAIRDVIAILNDMEAATVVDAYAIGGAVGATFYLEPVATLDIDVFVAVQPKPGQLVISITDVLAYLGSRGCPMQGEYVMIAGWPVQFLPPSGPLVEEALAQAVERDVDGIPARVFSPEHLAAIALQTGRAKDKARLLQFLEAGAVQHERLQAILARHGLLAAWQRFERQFLQEQ